MSGHHSHHHDPGNHAKAFGFGIALNLAYIAVEVLVGLSVNSMALLADAGHNASDVFSLGLAWTGSHLSRTPPTARHTYGLRRSSILASLANAIILLIAIGAIALESVQRFSHPQEVPGVTLMCVAGLGVAINAATAALFMRGRREDLNIRSAFLHMAADAGVSAGVIVAGLIIKGTGWSWIDPIVSLVIVLVIAWGTWGLLKESMDLALDAVPKGIDPEKVRSYLGALPGIDSVHDLHIWGMSTTQSALTVHLVKPDGRIDDELLNEICHELHERFGVEHATIQFETGAIQDCRPATPGTV